MGAAQFLVDTSADDDVAEDDVAEDDMAEVGQGKRVEKIEPGQDYMEEGRRTTPYFPFSSHFVDYEYVDYKYYQYSDYPTPTPFTTTSYNNNK
eukprot:TRINITY_DN31754_c0_g1_i1.p1 TRINITY_DN31754_c0_g1~~TRINITY_DN31754_c0_g1_i1.p1  ORF type:complete len:101 (-),score=39.19 TRINITY_DN31754_c0_g1_i1:295-573(-)